MVKPKTLAADPALVDLVTAGRPPVVDVDEALTASVKADAGSANADAVIAEVEARRLALVVEAQPGDELAAENLGKARRIAADRRRRADALMARAGVTSRHELDKDMRLWAATQLDIYQRQQVKFEDRLANPDLYVVADDEATLNRHHDSPPPLTAAKIRDDALSGRCQIRALSDWLDERLTADGPLPDDDPSGANSERAHAVAKLRRYQGRPPAAPDDDAEVSQS